jgi:hypothetical protein
MINQLEHTTENKLKAAQQSTVILQQLTHLESVIGTIESEGAVINDMKLHSQTLTYVRLDDMGIQNSEMDDVLRFAVLYKLQQQRKELGAQLDQLTEFIKGSE